MHIPISIPQSRRQQEGKTSSLYPIRLIKLIDFISLVQYPLFIYYQSQRNQLTRHEFSYILHRTSILTSRNLV